MNSPSDLFDDSSQPVRAFAPALASADHGVHPQPGVGRSTHAFRPPGFPLIHHLLQPGGPRRILSVNRQQEEDGVTVRRVDEDIDGREERQMEGGEDNLLQVKKRHGADWSEDALKMKRMKLRDGEVEERDKRREGGRDGKRREKEELKEQLEEARERLQLLQERVWKAFGEKHREEEEEKKEDEEDITGGMYDEEDIDGGQMEKETFSLLAASTFEDFHKRKEDRELRLERGRASRLEGEMEGSGMWMDCRELLRGDWNGGMEDEGEEGGQKFAQALKLELGSAVARVIDRVLRLYTEMTDHALSSPPASISFHQPDSGLDGGNDGGALPPGPPLRSEPDQSMPLAVHRSPDTRKPHPLLGPPLSTHLNPPQPNLSLHHPPLPRPSDPSSSFHTPSSSSSSSSSFPAPPPPPPPPLPLPLLHYSMQQLFSRSLPHPQLHHLPPSRKDYLSPDSFLEFSSPPAFPPLSLLSHLDPLLVRHGGRERERGVRGDGGVRGGGVVDGGELYLTAHVYSQEGLSPCHLKKAKLMFFYTRYPSSNTLKTYFPDVKFNRCVTSQMIKWFSNFREFFYIQMERFARQAVREALTRWLRVGRETELYRILNMHYNKSNVYQVPERFLEVSEVALREFYSAIWTGRDSDPCWKKGIYKIICKLDSPLPEAFRMPGCPVG
uniref:Prospero homeobox 3 n=1 Tax=Oryzias latipes TaxID=8090 RepID=A0A3P9HQ62_ORYLA